MLFIWWGIIIFGLGGLITGLLGDNMLLGFAVMGALGGGTLPFLLHTPKKAWLGTLFGAVGFFIAFVSMFFLFLAIWEPPYPMIFIGLVAGAIGGLSLGASIRSWQGASYMALGGMIGFGIGMALLEGLNSLNGFQSLFSQTSWAGFTMMIVGMVGGVGLGISLKLLKKKNKVEEG